MIETEKKKSIESFKNRFEKEIEGVDYEEFNKYFFVETFFYNIKLPYFEDRFFKTIFEIATNILKNYLQELDYYVSVKPTNIQTTCDHEVISKDIDKVTKMYLEAHIVYKRSHQVYLKGKNNDEVTNLIKDSFKIVKDIAEYSISVQDKLIENLRTKLKEMDGEEKEVKFESSVYH